jgi:uncharacterized damage-inducible protein DinB
MTERETILAQYQQGAGTIMSALANLPEDAIAWKPDLAEWSVAEILWHCAECEAVFHTRIRTIWIGPNRTVVAFDQDDWAGTPGYVGLPVQAAIDVIRSMREMTTALIASLSHDAWDIEGTHTENGRVTLQGAIAHAAGHLDIHAQQIRDNVRMWHAQARKNANEKVS